MASLISHPQVELTVAVHPYLAILMRDVRIMFS
jgi:hypothetical protein